MLICHCVGVLQGLCVTVFLSFFCAGVSFLLLCYCAGELLCLCVTVFMCYCAASLSKAHSARRNSCVQRYCIE